MRHVPFLTYAKVKYNSDLYSCNSVPFSSPFDNVCVLSCRAYRSFAQDLFVCFIGKRLNCTYDALNIIFEVQN